MTIGFHLLLYGLLGLVLEVVYTALAGVVEALVRRQPIDGKLQGQTYLWMLPIYGAGGLLLEEIQAVIEFWPWIARGLIYALTIFLVEYLAGWAIEKIAGVVPWDYSDRRWHVHGKIRLDYLPVWFSLGLLFEVAMGWVHTTASALLG